MVKRPNTRTNLDKAIQRLYGQTIDFVNIRSLMANVIVGQFMTDAVAKGGSERAHDLIDLQIVAARGLPDLRRLNAVCRRLFAYRHKQAWPPTVVKNGVWDKIYKEELGSLPLLPTVDEAIVWANGLIADIDAADGR